MQADKTFFAKYVTPEEKLFYQSLLGVVWL